MVIGALAVSVAALFLWQQLQSTSLGYEVQAARSRNREQRDRNAYLRLELARLHSPERLAKDARERLSMAPPSPERLVFLAGFTAPGRLLARSRPEAAGGVSGR